MLDVNQFATIQQNHAHESVSARYGFVSTQQVLDVLADHDWHPSTIREMNVRKQSRRGFQKHMIRLRRGADLTRTATNDRPIPELVFLNAHDRSAQVELMLGLWRFVCHNGLMIGDTLQAHKIRHIGYTAEKVATALNAIVTDAPKALESVERFRDIELTDREQLAYAESAIELVNDGEKFAMNPNDILAARRFDDRKSDLWTTFNRVQENVIRGEIAHKNKDGKSRRTRPVKSIDRNVDLNRALWSLTEKMAELKTA